MLSTFFLNQGFNVFLNYQTLLHVLGMLERSLRQLCGLAVTFVTLVTLIFF